MSRAISFIYLYHMALMQRDAVGSLILPRADEIHTLLFRLMPYNRRAPRIRCSKARRSLEAVAQGGPRQHYYLYRIIFSPPYIAFTITLAKMPAHDAACNEVMAPAR